MSLVHPSHTANGTDPHHADPGAAAPSEFHRALAHAIGPEETVQRNPHQLDPSTVTSGQREPAQPPLGHVRPDQLETGRPNPDHAHPDQLKPGRPNPDHNHPDQLKPGRRNPDRIRPGIGHVHPSQLPSSQRDPGLLQPGVTAPEEQPAGIAWLTVLPWADPVIDQLGVDPRSEYVERYWLPLVGPASVLLMRYLAHRFDESPEGFTLDVTHTARVLGLGTGLGRWGPLQRTVHRCANFGFVRRWGDERVLARRHLPTVTRQQLARLPEDRQALHQQWRVELTRPTPRTV